MPTAHLYKVLYKISQDRLAVYHLPSHKLLQLGGTKVSLKPLNSHIPLWAITVFIEGSGETGKAIVTSKEENEWQKLKMDHLRLLSYAQDIMFAKCCLKYDILRPIFELCWSEAEDIVADRQLSDIAQKGKEVDSDSRFCSMLLKYMKYTVEVFEKTLKQKAEMVKYEPGKNREDTQTCGSDDCVQGMGGCLQQALGWQPT
ncbi:hypothetical protein Nmel_014160, partial [Mimus melanotis]